MIEALAIGALLSATPDWAPAVEALTSPRRGEAYARLAPALLDVDAFADRALQDAKLAPADRARVAAALARRVRARLDGWARSKERASCAIAARAPERLTLTCAARGAPHTVGVLLGADGRAVDLELDGVLLSRNYRARMNRALRTRAPPAVIAELEAGPAGGPLTP